MSGVRKLQLKIEALRALSQVSPMVLMEGTLQTQLRILISPVPLLSEIREVLNELESGGLIVGVRGEDLLKWGITDSGKAKLTEWAP